MIIFRKALTPRIRNLIGFNAMLILLFCLVVAYHSSDSYRHVLSTTQRNAESLANSLADHTELSFLVADLTVRRAIERQYINTLVAGELNAYTNQQFKTWLDETPQVVGIVMVDEQGSVAASAQKQGYDAWPSNSKIISGSDLLSIMRDGNDRTMFISVHSLPSGQRLIVLSRRVDKTTGEFGGFVMVALNPKYFEEFYRSISVSELAYMRVVLNKDVLTASAHAPEGFASDSLNVALQENEQRATQDKANILVVNVNERMAVVASKKLRNLPISVSVVFGEREAFEQWRAGRDKDVWFLVLFTLFATVLSFFAVAMSRQMARAEQSENTAILASQAKSEFLANMSHELRTPLNAVIGYSEMLNSEYFGPLNQKQKERVHDINLCGTHLLQLINDILEFSKGDAGKLELAEETVDIAEVINETTRITNGRARMKNIRLITVIDPGLLPLWGDRRKIAQTLLNLMTNAVKFTPENGTVRVSAKMDQYKALNIIVSDTGVGMSEEDIPKALSVFGQVHRSQSHEGTGLGLPLCKMYTELHGGKLILTSKLGSGTTVRLVFPYQRTLTRKS
jgi:two-component system, cell cycle sensor histidine kinase PleC